MNDQGTVNVQSLIADYRAKHPEEIPTRGRRIRQSSKLGAETHTLSNSPTPPLSSLVPPPLTSAGASSSHLTNVPSEASSMSFKVR